MHLLLLLCFYGLFLKEKPEECFLSRFLSVISSLQPQFTAASHWIPPEDRPRLKYLACHSKHCWGRWQWWSSIPHRVPQPLLGFKSHSEQTVDTPVTSLPSVWWSSQHPTCVWTTSSPIWAFMLTQPETCTCCTKLPISVGSVRSSLSVIGRRVMC